MGLASARPRPVAHFLPVIRRTTSGCSRVTPLDVRPGEAHEVAPPAASFTCLSPVPGHRLLARLEAPERRDADENALGRLHRDLDASRTGLRPADGLRRAARGKSQPRRLELEEAERRVHAEAAECRGGEPLVVGGAQAERPSPFGRRQRVRCRLRRQRRWRQVGIERGRRRWNWRKGTS